MMLHMRRTILVSMMTLPCAFGYITQSLTTGGQTYTLQRIDNTGISFYLNSQIVPNLVSGNTQVLTAGSNPTAAAQAALASWNAVTTANVHFNALQTTATGHDPSDCRNTIIVASTPADLSAVGGALAVTLSAYSVAGPVCGGTKDATPGTIYDADIVFSPSAGFSTDNVANTIDFQSVLTHELGHSLGANHSALIGSTMFWNTGPNQFNQRILSTDDVAFVTALYPAVSTNTGTLTGRISSSDGPVQFGLISAIDQTTGVVLGSITASDGSYSLTVPAGSYIVGAEPFNSFISSSNIYASTTYSSTANILSSIPIQATTGFLPAFVPPVAVAAGKTATVNVVVTKGASSLTSPVYGVGTPGGAGDISGLLPRLGGPVAIASGQSIDVGMGAGGVDANTTFLVFGRGISVKSGSVRPDPKVNFGPGLPLMRFTLDIPAQTDTTLATLWIVKGNDILAFSGGLVITPAVPTFTTNSIVNAASYKGAGVVSPGGISSIYDSVNNSLGPATPVSNTSYDSNGNLPASAGGVSVTFNGVTAPIYFAYAGQINLQVPFELAGSTSAQVVVTYNGSKSAPVTVSVAPAQPAFFTATALGSDAIIQNFPDYTLNSASNPIARGGVVILYGTGIGKLPYTLATGQPGVVPPSSYASTYSCSFGGQTTSAYGYWNYGYVGEATWTVGVPAASPTGPVALTCTDSVSGAKTQPGTIYVK